MLEFDRIYNSDCIEGMKQIESGKVDLIVRVSSSMFGGVI